MKALLVAKLTLRRMLRANYLIALLFIAALVVLVFFNQAKAGSDEDNMKIINSASGSLYIIIALFLTFSPAFLSVFILPDEIASGHMRMNLTKPVSAFTVMVGHYLAMAVFLTGAALVFSILLSGSIVMRGGEPGIWVVAYVMHFVPLYAAYLALANLVAIVFNRPLAFAFSVALVSEELLHRVVMLFARSDLNIVIRKPLEIIAWLVYEIVPPISRFREVPIAKFIEMDFRIGSYLTVIAYCIVYTALVLTIAGAVCRRKEI